MENQYEKQYGEMFEPTSPEQRKKLAIAGFVRVDGLMTYLDENPEYVINTNTVRDRGRYNNNDGKIVIVTLGGEVWLSASNGSVERQIAVLNLFSDLAPRGHGAFIPCSNGEQIKMSVMLARMADPDYSPQGML